MDGAKNYWYELFVRAFLNKIRRMIQWEIRRLGRELCGHRLPPATPYCETMGVTAMTMAVKAAAVSSPCWFVFIEWGWESLSLG